MTMRFSASNAARFTACPASANLELAIPGYVAPDVDPNAGAKGRGTLMHEALELLMQFNASEREAVMSAFQYVHELKKRRRFKTLTEAKATATWLPSKPTSTVDLVLYTQDELHVVDYKMGRIPVYVDDNLQLIFYALCFGYLAPRAKGITVHIVQPFADNYGSRTYTTDELKQFMTELQQAEAKVVAKDLTFGPSDHCTFCPANPHSRGDKGHPLCPAMLQLLYPATFDEKEMLT